MPITWSFCDFLQHVRYQIKAEVPAHTGKVIDVCDCIGFRTCFHGRVKLFLIEFIWQKRLLSSLLNIVIFTSKSHIVNFRD